MDFRITCISDIGTTRPTNQDNFYARVITIDGKPISFAVVCDGMGGYEKGEVASASVIGYFEEWFETRFESLFINGLSDNVIRSEWSSLINKVNEGLVDYSESNNIKMGSTLTAVLATEERYYVVNVGDSRTYMINCNSIKQISKDHSFVQHEVDAGRLTAEEALVDKRRNILTQCIGVQRKTVSADFFFGKIIAPVAFMLCSDGFWHELSDDEIIESISSYDAYDEIAAKTVLGKLVECVKARGETDNITVAVCKALSDQEVITVSMV